MRRVILLAFLLAVSCTSSTDDLRACPTQSPVPTSDGAKIIDTETAVEIGGHRACAARPGTNTILVTVRNLERTAQRHLGVGIIYLGDWGAKVTDDNDFVDLAPGGTAVARFIVVVPRTRCFDHLFFQFERRESASTTVGPDVHVPVICPPAPRLESEGYSVVGGDGDNIPEPGENLRVDTVIKNVGEFSPYLEDLTALPGEERASSLSWPIHKVIAELTSLTPGVTVGNAHPGLAVLEGWQDAQLSFTIQIKPYVQRAMACNHRRSTNTNAPADFNLRLSVRSREASLVVRLTGRTDQGCPSG